jgi:predicted metal-dependent peptidase
MDRRRRDRDQPRIERDVHARRKFEDSDDECSDVDEQWNRSLRQKVNQERNKEAKKAAADGNRLRVVQRCVVRVSTGKKEENVFGPLF